MPAFGLLLALTPPSLMVGSVGMAPARSASPVTRAAVVACDTEPPVTIPDSVVAAAPPGQLADAWKRDEAAKELIDLLKGCSIYVVGLGGRKSAVARVLARRLRYRNYDVSNLMCSTYAALNGGGSDALSLNQLVAKEPLVDVEQLASAILSEVQQFTRSVFVTWDGAVSPTAFAVMQQGLVVNLDFEATVDDDVALPADDADGAKQRWVEGHAKADVTVSVASGSAADDAAYQTIDALLAFVKANPAKSQEWKETADAKLAEADDN